MAGNPAETRRTPNFFERASRFFGLNSSFEYLLEVAANPRASDKRFQRLVKDPEGYGPGLTDAQQEKLGELLSSRAQGYSGNARIVMLSRLKHIGGADQEWIERSAAEAVDKGEAEPKFLMQRLGVRALARVDGTISTPFLEEEIRKGRKDTMKGLLNGLGLESSDERYLVTSEAIVPWLPSVMSSLEQMPPDQDCFKFVNRYRNFKYDIYLKPEKIERFFASFPYQNALPHLLRALDSDIHVVGSQVLSSTIVNERVERDGEGYGSWQGEYGYYQDRKFYDVEDTHAAYYPVAEGAVQSLLRLAEIELDLRSAVENNIERCHDRPKKQYVLIRHGERGESVGEPYGHYYYREAR